ncbi:MAG TPA: hypothetical protein VJB95_03090 [Candidatus Paceibacterota bacterium]
MQRLVLIFLITFSILLTSGAAIAQDRAGDANSDVPTSYVRNSEIQNIKKIIGKKTPDFIAKPVIAVVTALENFRLAQAEKSEGKVYHFVFANVFIFYGIFIIILFLLLRIIWRIIF